MRRVTPPPPPAALRPRLVMWLLAAVAIGAVLFVDRKPVLDRGALASEFQAGRVDVALMRLAVVPDEALPEPLRAVDWWPAPRRAGRLSRLGARAPSELLESPTQPTLTAPLGSLRDGPGEVRLRDPAGPGLTLELRNVDLDLLAAERGVPEGAVAVSLDVPWIPGARYALLLRDGDGAMLALAGFRLLDDASSRTAAEAMTAAHDLAVPSHEGSSLLAALAALDAGLALEAIERLAPLESVPGYEAVAHELHVLALETLGLDWSARRLMAAGPEERR